MAISNLKPLPIDSTEELERFIARLRWIHGVFTAPLDYRIDAHRNLDKICEFNTISPGRNVREFPRGPAANLPLHFDVPKRVCERLSVEGCKNVSVEALLEEVNTLGIGIVHNNKLVYEKYAHGNDENTRWMSNSASKFVVGLLIAIAKEEGLIHSLSDPVVKYWPELAGTGWDGVTIEHCLCMTSGIEFDEYSLDTWKDGHYTRLFYGIAFGSLEEHVIAQGSKATPGTRVEYSSINTEVLGGILIRVTGMAMTEYLEEKIWKPAGLEHSAYWLTDTNHREVALAGLCATLRDYLRLGTIMVNRGQFNGQQIVPAWYADRLSRVDDAHFKLAGSQNDAVLNWLQVFVPSDPSQNRGDYMACGSYGQNIYVNPACNVVIATHSMYPNIWTEEAEMFKHFFAFRAIAESLRGEPISCIRSS